jgi:hypothetical protein
MVAVHIEKVHESELAAEWMLDPEFVPFEARGRPDVRNPLDREKQVLPSSAS